MLLNAPLPSVPAMLPGLAITQLCSGVPGLSFLNLRPSLELTLVLGLDPRAGVDGMGGGGPSCLLFWCRCLGFSSAPRCFAFRTSVARSGEDAVPGDRYSDRRLLAYSLSASSTVPGIVGLIGDDGPLFAS